MTDYERIMATVGNLLEGRIEAQRIDTTVFCGDLLAWTRRSLGQTGRQALARIERTRQQFGVRP